MKYKVLGKQNNTDRCFVCGMDNPAGTKAQFYHCEKDGEVILLTVIKPQSIHQSYPNRMHGGVVSALLDESIGRAMQIEKPELWGVTIDLNVKFRCPCPLDTTLYIESRVTSQNARSFEGEGKLLARIDGEIKTIAQGTGKYFILPQDKLFDDKNKLTDKNWFLVKEKLPEFIELL